MKIHGTAKGGILSKKDFGVAFGGGVACNANTVTDGTSGSATGIAKDIVGQQITTGNSLVGESCCSVTMRIKRIGSPSGNMTAGRVNISDTSGNFEDSFDETVDVSTVPTSYTDYTFTGTGGTIEADDVIGVKIPMAGEGENNYLDAHFSNQSYSNGKSGYLSGGSWGSNTSWNIIGSIGTS